MQYKCPKCGRTYPLTEAVWRCECGSHLNSEGATPITKEDILAERHSLWRYEKALPLVLDKAATNFQEGMTPLVDATWSGKSVKFKLDYMMPTGSFKDRGSAILVNHLKDLGITHVLEDSSGNAGASTAAYCSAAGIKCDMYVPASTSAGKLFQISMYGANLIKIPGSRQDVAEAALKAADSTFYASHNWHPLYLEGTKTVAFELWEQLGWKAPDNIVVPLGMGSALLGLYIGFRELLLAGQVLKMPRLFAMQAGNCAPFYHLFDPTRSPGPVRPTIAEGIACEKPVRGKEVVDAIKSTGGSIESVAEEDIVEATFRVAKLGFCIEPTSGTALAGLTSLIEAGGLSEDQTTVVILTGNGLKSVDKMMEAARNRP